MTGQCSLFQYRFSPRLQDLRPIYQVIRVIRQIKNEDVLLRQQYFIS
jgi:hypothetical protein